MHELPVIGRILAVVLGHAEKNGVGRILSIDLEISQVSDLEEEWMQHYFDSFSQGTLAQGARLNVERKPLRLRCSACSREFEADINRLEEILCPSCGNEKCRRIPGGEYYIKSMEAM